MIPVDRNAGRQARGQRAHRPTTAHVSFPQLSFQFSFSNFKFQMVPANGSPGPTPPTNTLPSLDRSPRPNSARSTTPQAPTSTSATAPAAAAPRRWSPPPATRRPPRTTPRLQYVIMRSGRVGSCCARVRPADSGRLDYILF